jgi:hypothetical protein
MIPAEVVGTADPIHPRCQHRLVCEHGRVLHRHHGLDEIQVRNYILRIYFGPTLFQRFSLSTTVKWGLPRGQTTIAELVADLLRGFVCELGQGTGFHQP